MTLRIAIVGLGKIARDQHVPAIAATPGLVLAAVASRNAALDGVPSYPSIEALLESDTPIDAVALCTPPQGRHAQAWAALQAGKHVLLEKPPGAAVGEVGPLADLARRQGVTLFASWHSRHAPGVEPARAFLASRTIHSVAVAWKEDVRVWHPGQDWIWQPGGLGVFDPGINALSIVTRILPRPIHLTAAALSFPANRAAPIAASLAFTDAAGLDGQAVFDWRQTGPQQWNITVETDAGRLFLSHGGAHLALNDQVLSDAPRGEYPALYQRFAQLVAARDSDVDLSPLVHVADAFMLGRRLVVEPFTD